MAQRHWLDPLARQLLIASGQLPRPDRSPATSQAAEALGARPGSSRQDPAPGHGSALVESHDDAIERDLLALKLAREPGRRLSSAEEVRHAAALGWRLDVNRATAADWLRLPGCRSEQVDLLLRLQAGGVQLSGLDDLQRLLALSEAELTCWQPLLEFRWYGTAPAAASRCEAIAVNQAGARELERLPGIGAELVSRLLRERVRRPFSDLADLQQRLQLSAAIVEAWIGRVAFQSAPAGPVLPPANRPGP
ncbi:MAG: hypothetical protein WCI65_09935 [Synechococcaceae cyanobacterium ELA263]